MPESRSANTVSRRRFLSAALAAGAVGASFERANASARTEARAQTPHPAGHNSRNQQTPRKDRYEPRLFPPASQPAINGVRHQVLTAHPASGPGPGVIVLHEITGATDEFFVYADTLVDAGFSVHCPVMFGSPFGRSWWLRDGISILRACNPWSEFECRTRSALSQINPWLVELAVDVSGNGQRKIGAIGMCLTGIQPLAMLRCRAVVAPVLCQPTLPLGKSERAQLDLGLPPSDVDFACTRVKSEPVNVLMVRYANDTIASAPRAKRLCEMFGAERITCVSVPGDDHSSLVHDPSPQARKAVVDFLLAELS